MEITAERLALQMMRAEHGDNPREPRVGIYAIYLRQAHLALDAMKAIQLQDEKDGHNQAVA